MSPKHTPYLPYVHTDLTALTDLTGPYGKGGKGVRVSRVGLRPNRAYACRSSACRHLPPSKKVIALSPRRAAQRRCYPP
jgi:hypothetical protein